MKGGLGWYQSHTKVTPTLWTSPCTTDPSVLMASLHREPESHPTHWCAKNNQGPTTIGGHTQHTHTGATHRAQVSSDTVSLDRIGHLVHKANLSKLENIAHLPNMSGQGNLSQMNKQDQTLEKKICNGNKHFNRYSVEKT